MTVKELKEQLEDFGDHLEIVVANEDGQYEIDSIDTAPLHVNSQKEGMTGVLIYTSN